MTTLVLDPPPAEFQALLERRKRLDQDRHDEVWEGVYHMAPAPRNAHTDIQQQLTELLSPLARRAGLHPLIAGELNLGEPQNFRVPDGALLRRREDALWNPTAALAVEIVSPGDETWEKLPFYAARHVDELLIIDPATRSIDWLALSPREGEDGGEYRPVERSALIDLGPGELAERIDWPPLAGAGA
jgi:Uma2 family endonuclease